MGFAMIGAFKQIILIRRERRQLVGICLINDDVAGGATAASPTKRQ